MGLLNKLPYMYSNKCSHSKKMPLFSNSIKYNSTALSEYIHVLINRGSYHIKVSILNTLLFLENEVMTLSQISTPHLRHQRQIHVSVLAPVVQKVDNAIHRINHYPMDSVVCFVNIYPVDSVIQPLNNWGLDTKLNHHGVQCRYVY